MIYPPLFYQLNKAKKKSSDSVEIIIMNIYVEYILSGLLYKTYYIYHLQTLI